MNYQAKSRITHAQGMLILIKPIGLFFCLFWNTAQAAPVGAIPGSLAVSETGGATYSIPIAVPPGIGGMEPRLSLNYSSQAGNGLMGMGWSLSGLSVIHRCPRTMAQDGVVGGVNYDMNDRYCLDGQRLIAINGDYGANGTEYRVEHESHTRIISYGSAGNGPAWFKVWTKSGQVVEYGNTTDSRIEAQGKTTAMLWALNKASDVVGNYFAVTYAEDNSNGQYYPARIDYTGNSAANTTPTNSVQFVYETRPDIAPMYQVGSLIKNTVRMSRVKSYAGTAVTREYLITYGLGAATQRSRITSLSECAGDGTCLPATTFEWQDDSPGSFTAIGSVTTNYQWSSPTPGDFNGDGKADFMINTGTANVGWHLYLSNGDGTFTRKDSVIPNPQWSSLTPTDFNNDGRTDFLINTGTAGVGWHLYLSNGDGTFTQKNSVISNPQWSSPTPSDFNGDGKTDFLINTGTAGVGWHLYLSNGDGTFTRKDSIISNPVWSNPTPGDFNGDGKTDFLINTRVYDTGWYVYFANGDGSFTYKGKVTNYPQWTGATTGDFNGDGKADYLINTMTDGAGWYAYLSKGDGTFIYKSNPGPYYQWNGTTTGDFNGDGRTDFLINTVTVNAGWFPYRSNGDGTFTHTSYPARNFQWTGATTADFNGDGRTDFLINTRSASTGWYVYLADSAGTTLPDLLTAVRNGLSATTTLTYAPLTDPAVYTKDSDAAYPTLDVLAPMYVVANVESSDGVDGNRTVSYRYGGLKADLQGRGLLGFRTVEATNVQTGITSRTEYRQDFPYTGLASHAEQRLSGGTLIGQTDTTYGLKILGTGSATRYFPYAQQSVEERYELDSSLVARTTTSQTYDDWGNALTIDVLSQDGHRKTTTNTYDNDTTNWLLGRLRRATVTSTSP